MKLIKNAKKNFFIASDNLLNEYIGEEEIETRIEQVLTYKV